MSTTFLSISSAYPQKSMLVYRMTTTWNALPSDDSIAKTIKHLKENGIEAIVVQNGQEAKEKALSLIPEGAEIMTMTSVTLDTLELTQEINESGKFDAVKPKLYSKDRASDNDSMQKLGAAPNIAIGSVHAVTETGHVYIASNTGSQLPAYVYGSDKVIWIVGAQKIVKDDETAMKRIYNHVLPLESERAHKAYGMTESNVSKLLIVNKEVKPNRITMIIVKEVLGF